MSKYFISSQNSFSFLSFFLAVAMSFVIGLISALSYAQTVPAPYVYAAVDTITANGPEGDMCKNKSNEIALRVSADGGSKWVKKVIMPTSGNSIPIVKEIIAKGSVVAVKFNTARNVDFRCPLDPGLATAESGIAVSFDHGDHWTIHKVTGIDKVNDMIINTSGDVIAGFDTEGLVYFTIGPELDPTKVTKEVNFHGYSFDQIIQLAADPNDYDSPSTVYAHFVTAEGGDGLMFRKFNLGTESFWGNLSFFDEWTNIHQLSGHGGTGYVYYSSNGNVYQLATLDFNGIAFPNISSAYFNSKLTSGFTVTGNGSSQTVLFGVKDKLLASEPGNIRSWRVVNTIDVPSNHHIDQIIVSDNGINTYIIAGFDEQELGFFGSVYFSIDSGRTWAKTSYSVDEPVRIGRKLVATADEFYFATTFLDANNNAGSGLFAGLLTASGLIDDIKWPFTIPTWYKLHLSFNDIAESDGYKYFANDFDGLSTRYPDGTYSATFQHWEFPFNNWTNGVSVSAVAAASRNDVPNVIVEPYEKNISKPGDYILTLRNTGQASGYLKQAKLSGVHSVSLVSDHCSNTLLVNNATCTVIIRVSADSYSNGHFELTYTGPASYSKNIMAPIYIAKPTVELVQSFRGAGAVEDIWMPLSSGTHPNQQVLLINRGPFTWNINNDPVFNINSGFQIAYNGCTRLVVGSTCSIVFSMEPGNTNTGEFKMFGSTITTQSFPILIHNLSSMVAGDSDTDLRLTTKAIKIKNISNQALTLANPLWSILGPNSPVRVCPVAGHPTQKACHVASTCIPGMTLAFRGSCLLYLEVGDHVNNVVGQQNTGTIFITTGYENKSYHTEVESHLYIGLNSFDSSLLGNTILRWDGSNASTVGLLDEESTGIMALDYYQGDLYFGGQFSEVVYFPEDLPSGEVKSNNIAKWNGSTVSAIGTGVNAAITSLSASDDKLYMGGLFTQAGNAQANYVSSWNGSVWDDLGLPEIGPVNAVHSRATELLVGGRDVDSGKGEFSVRSGGNWVIYNNFEGPVQSIASGDVYSYIAGTVRPLNSYYKGVVQYSNHQFHPTGHGIIGSVNTIAVDSNNITYAGGVFNSYQAGGIAKWNGIGWSAMGTGASGDNAQVFTMALDGNDHLYVGGVFDSVDGVATNNIAFWNGSFWSAVNIFPLDASKNLVNDLYVGPTLEIK